MLQYFQPIIDYLHQNPDVGVLIAFLIALAESLPLIGTIIPGSVTMTAIGTLVGTGTLPGLSTLAWASLGAFIGDTLGFSVGYLFTEKVRHMWPFKKYPHWLALSEQFFEKHGGKSIIFGRFVGPARSTIPLVAGLLKMTWLRFILAAIPSAIMWAILYMVPGILLGALALELPPHVATEFLFIGILVIIGLWLVFWALQYFFAQIAHMINVMIDKFWDVLIRHKPSRPFIRLIAVKGKPTDHYQLILTILALLSGLLFLFIFYSVAQDGWLTGLNFPIFSLLQSLHTKHFNHFFIIITCLGSIGCMATVGALTSLGLAAARQWRAAIHLLLIDILMFCAVGFFKTIFYNPRPTGFGFVATSSSFPSGHTGMSFVILSALAYFSTKLIKHSRKWIPYTISIVGIILIALSRLYLGAHWLTDILGSITLGFTILFIVIINYRRRHTKQFQTLKKTYWFILIFFSIALPSSLWIYKDYHFSLYRYQPYWPTVNVNMNTWWKNPEKYLPLYRLNRFGSPIQPFNLQWAGHLSDIQSVLKKQHWTILDPKYSVKGTLKRFVNKKQAFHLPLFPWLYHHQPPSLILMKKVPNSRNLTIEIRLWHSSILFTQQKVPLWIGTINYHIPPSKKLSFSRFKEVSLQASGGIKQLSSDIKKSRAYEYRLLNIPFNQQPKKVQILDWDGHVIVIRPYPVS